MKCEVLVDWLTFSVKSENVNQVIEEYLGMSSDLFQDGPGLLGYEKSKSFNNIVVCYEGRENDYFHNMGVCVSMTGNGCRTFETMSKLPDQDAMGGAFPVLFGKLAGNPLVNVSRIDIACDDHEGYLDMEQVVQKTMDNDINSRMTKRQVVVSLDGTQQDGSTVYIGSPSSDFRLRIYDKALEQGQSGQWVRVEMVMRGNNATGFVDQVIGVPVGTLAAKVLNDKFSFIEKDDSNISRCSVCSWWANFVDDVESVCLFSRKVIQHAIEHVAKWVNDQVGPSLAMISASLGLDHIIEIIHKGRKRLTGKQECLVNDYQAALAALHG